jgi:NADH dehydrogenase (ubiquinone) Fe-S protein 3
VFITNDNRSKALTFFKKVSLLRAIYKFKFSYSLQKNFLVFLLQITGGLIKQIQIKNQILEIKTSNDNIYHLSLFLKKHSTCQYKTLVDLIACDFPGGNFRFSLIYNLLSVDYNSRILVCTKVLEKLPVISTIVPIFSGAG